MYRGSQHQLSLIRFPTCGGLVSTPEPLMKPVTLNPWPLAPERKLHRASIDFARFLFRGLGFMDLNPKPGEGAWTLNLKLNPAEVWPCSKVRISRRILEARTERLFEIIRFDGLGLRGFKNLGFCRVFMRALYSWTRGLQRLRQEFRILGFRV